MGTNAVFAVATKNKGMYYTYVLGTTMDGFPENLEACARYFMRKARDLRVTTRVKKNEKEAVHKVIQAIGEDPNTMWFDANVKDAEFIRHSAIFDPKRNKLELFEDLFEESQYEVSKIY